MSQFNATVGDLYHKPTMTNREVLERLTDGAAKSGRPPDPVFLVLERDPLIAEDIMGSLRAIGPCRVVRASDASGVDGLLRHEGRISAAFLDVRFAKVVEKQIDARLKAHGARIILTVGEDDQAQALSRGWGMLIRPFTEKMIRDVVAPKPLR